MVYLYIIDVSEEPVASIVTIKGCHLYDFARKTEAVFLSRR